MRPTLKAAEIKELIHRAALEFVLRRMRSDE
jgi:hypothetical protein